MKKTIVIIEDEAELADMLKLRLEAKDYKVLIAYDGEAGLKILRKLKPDLLILDINIPKVSGIEVYNQIAGAKGKAPFPVLILTAREELEDFFEDIEAEGFISKPFDSKQLMKEIDRIMSGKKSPIVFFIDLRTALHMVSIRLALKRKGFKVAVIEDIETLKEYCSHQRPSCVFIEYAHQNAAPADFIKALRQMPGSLPKKIWPAGYNVPIIVYTFTDNDYMRQSAQAGADKYIGKPEGDPGKVFIDAMEQFEWMMKLEHDEKEKVIGPREMKRNVIDAIFRIERKDSDIL